MRLPNTRRGAHPKHRTGIDPPLSRAWFLDETTGDYSPSVWGSSTQNLGPHNGGAFATSPIVPYIVDSPVGMAKRFVGADITAMSTDSANPDLDSIDFLSSDGGLGDGQNATFAAWMYFEDFTNFSTVVYFGGDTNAGTANDNILFRIATQTSTGKFELNTEDGVASQSRWRSSYETPLNRWIYVCVVRKPSGGSQIAHDLYINGRFIENIPLDFGTGNTPSGGFNAYWQLGGQYTSNSGGSILLPFTGRIAGVYVWDRQLTSDEIEEDYRRGLLLPFHTSSQVRVAVEKPEPAPGTTSLYYDATQLDGLDFVSELNTSNSPDNACVQGSVKFLREQENLSLAYLKNDTKLNLVEPTSYGSVERFLDVYRQIRIFAATVPLGLDASGDDYWYMLDGRIDLIDWGTEEVTVNFRDKGGLLVDTFIEDEASYGTTDPLSPVIVNTVIDDIVTANDSLAKTGSYENPGAVIYDPPPGAAWAVNSYPQKREPVLVAIRTIAGQFGHDVKFKWYDPSESFRLQLYQPERDSVTLSAIFSPAEIKSISKAEIASQRVRNVVRVSYDSNETEGDQITNVTGITLPAGVTLNPPFPLNGTVNGTTSLSPGEGEDDPTPAFVELQNTSSINKYGRRFMEVQESSTSNINLGTEATRMAASMIQDLAEPEFDHSIAVPLIPFLDIHDIIGFQPNAYLYSADQYLAVSQITHNFTEEATTTMSVRGQPNLGVRRWMALESRGAPIPSNAPQEASTPLTKSEKLASLQSVLDKSQMNLGGKFTQVRNNAFMTWSNGRLNPPTGWSMDPLGGSWDNLNIRADGVSKTGALSVEFNDNTYVLVSDYIPIDGFSNQPYVLEATYKVIPTTAVTLDAEVSFYEADGTFIRTGGVPGGLGAPLAVNEWQTERGYFQPQETAPGNNDARYARIRVRKGSAVAGSVYLDNVSLYPAASACMVKFKVSTWNSDGVDPAGSSNIKNIQCSDTSGTSYYDYIGNVVDDSASPTPNDGTHFVVPATGIYDVFCQSAFNVSVVGGALKPISAGDNINILMYAFIDAQYGAGGIISSATRTVLKQQTTFTCPDIAAGANSDLNGFASVSGSFFAQAGDKISFGYGSSGAAYYPTGAIKSGDVTITNILDLTGSDPSSYFSVKQRLLD